MSSGLISSAIPNLINGVSQQPATLRLSSQCEEQENCYSSVVEGLRKRAGTTFKAKLTSAPSGDIFTHVIDRDLTERYQLLIGAGTLKVYDLLTGAEKTVSFPNGSSYLSAVTPQTAFRAVTIADYTFILNTETTVLADAATSPVTIPKALIWVKQGAYGTTYKVTIDGVTVSYTTPDGSTASMINQVQTDAIATQLVSLLTAALTGFTFTRVGSSILVVKNTSADFAITLTDSQGDQATRLVKGSVQRFSDLPAKGFDGFITEIIGDQASNFDNYFVKYVNSGGTTTGSWDETLKGGEQIAINKATMVHVLVRNSDGTFTFKQGDWKSRLTGDSETNPLPSFIGSPISDIFFHRNRLGFVADENIIMSTSGDFFNYFKETATQLLDTDPIDLAVSHIKVSKLKHAIPFNQTLLFFSEQTQFQLGSAELLTPETASVNQTTEFFCSPKVKPVGAGQNVYFAFNRGNHSGLREYFVDGSTKTNNATDVTSHVPAYVDKDIVKMTASTSEDVIAALCEGNRNTVFIYKYFWNEQEKLQSSWSKWIFPSTDTILSIDFIASDLFFVIKRADGVYIESMAVNPGNIDTDFTFGINLDRKVNEAQCTVSYNSTTDKTTITPPYAMQAGETYQIVTRAGDASRKLGQVVGYTVSGNTLIVSGNLTKFYLGRSYLMRYRFSTFMIREQAAGGGQTTVGEGRVQLRRAAITYSNTGYFRIEVTPFQRQTFVYPFSGRVIGSARNPIGSISLDDGRFSFPVMCKNDTVTIDLLSDSCLPCAVLSADWEALYTIRSNRM